MEIKIFKITLFLIYVNLLRVKTDRVNNSIMTTQNTDIATTESYRYGKLFFIQ